MYLDDYMIKHWRKTVHKTLPEFHQKYNHSLGVVINGFVDDVVSAATTICPQVAEPLGLWKQSVMKGAKPLKDNAEEIFQTKIKSTATDAHQLIVPKIREIWLPIYEKCGEEFGMLNIFLLAPILNDANTTALFKAKAISSATWRPMLSLFRNTVDPCIRNVPR